MKTKVWYREMFQPFEESSGGPWLVGKNIIEAYVQGAEPNPFGTLYSVITKDGKHDIIREYQIIYSKINGKKIKNKDIYDEFPFTNKKDIFWEFMSSAIWMFGFFALIGLGVAFVEPWLGLVPFVLGTIGSIGNGSVNYRYYKEAVTYLPKGSK